MYVELHARSAFSFLEGAALPEALAERAARLGQPALALLDRDGLYGAPRLYRAATRLGIAPLGGAEGAPAGAERLLSIYGRGSVYVELQRHLAREQEARNEWLRAEAARLRLPPLATNEPRLVERRDRRLLDVLTCIRHHTTLDRAGWLLADNSERHLKDDREMERLFHDCPEAVANTGELALRLGFTLKHLGYRFPDHPLPRGETPIGLPRAPCARGRR